MKKIVATSSYGKEWARYFLIFFYLLVLAENEIKKSLNKFDPWMSMVRLSRWLFQGNVFVLIFDLVQHVAPLFCSGHWHNYFLQLGQVVQASVQSIFLRCLCLATLGFSGFSFCVVPSKVAKASKGANVINPFTGIIYEFLQ